MRRPLPWVQQTHKGTLYLLPHYSCAVVIKSIVFQRGNDTAVAATLLSPLASCTLTGLRAEGALRWVCGLSLSRLSQQALLSMQASRAHHHDLSLQNRLRAWLHTGRLYFRGHPPQSRAEERTQWQVCNLCSVS